MRSSILPNCGANRGNATGGKWAAGSYVCYAAWGLKERSEQKRSSGVSGSGSGGGGGLRIRTGASNLIDHPKCSTTRW